MLIKKDTLAEKIPYPPLLRIAISMLSSRGGVGASTTRKDHRNRWINQLPQRESSVSDAG